MNHIKKWLQTHLFGSNKRRTAMIALLLLLVTVTAATVWLRSDGDGTGRSGNEKNQSDTKPSAGDGEKADKQAKEAAQGRGQETPGNPSRSAKSTIRIHIEGAHNTEGELYFTANGAKARSMKVELLTSNTSLKNCKLTDNIVVDDKVLSIKNVSYQPLASQNVLMEDGLHTVTVSCSDGGGIADTVKVRVADRQPKLCANHGFTDSAITAASFEELRDGVVGTWRGCVTSPWVPAYYTTITFSADGKYSAVSDESLDGQEMNAMYYGTEENDARKKYAIDDYEAAHTGRGQIDIVFADTNSINRGDLRNIKLMGNKLSFEFFHRGQYGPLTFQLYRQ